MNVVRTYPWGALDHVPREDVATIRRLGHWLETFDLTRANDALASLTRCKTDLRIHRVEATATAPREDALAVALTVGHTPLILEVEVGLACDLVARALGRSPPMIVTLTEEAELVATAGAFAAVARKILRHAGAPDVRVSSAGRSRRVMGDVPLPDPAAVGYTVTVDADAYRARLLFSRRVAIPPAGDTVGGARGLATRSWPIAVPIVLTAAWATAREIQNLARGDVWLTGRKTSDGLRAVALSAPAAERAVAAALEGDGRLVLGTSTLDMTMSDAAKDTIVESALDAPVVVRVELGVVELAAREWASLKPGDVVSTGTRIGTNVVLRAGTAELARGELVDIDGEVGVRITSLGGG